MLYVQPAHIIVFGVIDGLVRHIARKAVHRKVKRSIIVLHRTEVLWIVKRYVQLFPNLSYAGLEAGLTRFNLTSGEFPSAFKLAVSPLGGKYLLAVKNDGCGNMNVFHGTSSLLSARAIEKRQDAL